MNPPGYSPPRILVLESQEDLRFLLQLILRQAGYAVSLAVTLEAVWDVLAQETFALILADLPLSTYHPGSFSPAHQLRRRAHPTPVGVLVTESVPAEEARHAGFAFALRMPFSLYDLLVQVADVLQTSSSPAHAGYEGLVEHFLSALERGDQQDLLSRCTEKLTWYWLASTPERQLQGKGAVSTYLAAMAASVGMPLILDLRCYAVPTGLLACYTQVWMIPAGVRRREATTTFFQFEGERISQIGMRSHLGEGQERTQAG